MLSHCRALILLFGLLASSASIAAPAAWHWWQSKLDGRLFCAQASPGPGWIKRQRAYLDLNCTRPVQLSPKASRHQFEPGQPEADSTRESRTQRLE
jgi:hypothetical protein